MGWGNVLNSMPLSDDLWGRCMSWAFINSMSAQAFKGDPLTPTPWLGACPLLPAEEVQQCADAATEHVRFLEEQAEQSTAAHETALAALQGELEGVRCVLGLGRGRVLVAGG